jgi:hypothetical protein
MFPVLPASGQAKHSTETVVFMECWHFLCEAQPESTRTEEFETDWKVSDQDEKNVTEAQLAGLPFSRTV